MMRTFYVLPVAALFLLFAYSCEAQPSQQEKEQTLSQAETVKMYYFHFTRRCVTCKILESEAREAVETLYPELYRDKQISFESINLDTEEGMKLAEKLGVMGQSLLIVNGSDKADLVREGFMYARTAPEKFRQAIKQQIDGML